MKREMGDMENMKPKMERSFVRLFKAQFAGMLENIMNLKSKSIDDESADGSSASMADNVIAHPRGEEKA
jgi:hypothetical protein